MAPSSIDKWDISDDVQRIRCPVKALEILVFPDFPRWDQP